MIEISMFVPVQEDYWPDLMTAQIIIAAVGPCA